MLLAKRQQKAYVVVIIFSSQMLLKSDNHVGMLDIRTQTLYLNGAILNKWRAIGIFKGCFYFEIPTARLFHHE